ncbi:lipase family protein [Rhodococcus sp. NPDC058505]|uniref:lipase family protein n=1 Tax=unclassified Rhodococcus (in: high G+C Gram-positive bacteria) TaxID=192944 RepID=UPI003658F6E5
MSAHRLTTRLAAVGLGAALAAGVLAVGATATAATPAAGTVVASEPLPQDLWYPGTARAERLTYWTSLANGQPALSTGTVFVPEGTPPDGGWPVLSWAHGTVGLGDDCAPSVVGPGARDRDFAYLGTWLDQGYAIVASDYAGLGTPGVMPYLDGRAEAHSVVDMVKAGRSVEPDLSNAWVAIGQSQGGGAAITTARYATELGGPTLDYRGAVGTGVPAYIENIVAQAGPGFPPVALPAGLTVYALYILAGLNAAHPELGVPGLLNETGLGLLGKAETLCYGDLKDEVAGLVLGTVFAKPLSSIPNVHGVLTDYMGIPETGYDKPFFIGQGLKDTDIIMPSTLLLGGTLARNGEPVTFRTYPTDHSGTMAASLVDTVPFVRDLFDGRTPESGAGS